MRASVISRIGVCAALVLSLVVFAPPPAAEAGGTELHWLNPLPRGEQLNAVDIASGVSASGGSSGIVAYAVGKQGCTIKTYDGGATWVQKSSPVKSELLAVSFIDATRGWAAGAGGVILKMTDGASFQKQTSGTSDEIRSIYFRNSNLGWACTGTGKVLRTTDGGTTWTQQYLGGYYFEDVFFVSDSKGFLVSNTGDIFMSTDGGVTWPEAQHQYKGGTIRLADISFDPDDPQIGWIASGNGAPWKTTDGGTTWNTVSGVGSSWLSVVCAGGGSNVVWLAGYNTQPNRIGKVADSATPSFTAYADSAYGQDMPLLGIDCTSGTQALAVGQYGQVAFTTDGGSTWGHRDQKAPRDLLTGIQFIDLRTGYLLAGTGVWKSTNAGTSWSKTPAAASGYLADLYFIDTNNGWAVGSGGAIIKTANGGTSWTSQPSGVTSDLVAVHFTDATHGWAVGVSGVLVWTDDGGTTWTRQTLGGGSVNLADIDFLNTSVGAVVGTGGAVFLTTSGATNGGTWMPAADTPGTADLAAVDFASTGALYVGGLSRTYGGSTATLLKSANAGSSWTLVPADSLKRGEFTFRGPIVDLFFSSATDGWVAFHDGSLARTVDGGNTWTYAAGIGDAAQDISVVRGEYVWMCGPNGAIVTNYWYQTTKVYRFYNMKNGTHFYTSSYEEKAAVLKKWPDIYKYEGVGYEYDAEKANAPLYRLYNKKSASHFYTTSLAEAENAVKKWPTVFTYEGPAYNVSQAPVPGGSIVYRFYNVKNGSHFFTASSSERDMVIAKWPNVFRLEGEAYYLPQ